MKTLSGTSKVMALIAIGIVVILTLRAFGQGKPPTKPYADRKLVLRFTADTEVNEADFKNALKVLGEDQYKIHFKHDETHSEDFPPPPGVTIKTDKITTSEVAKNAAGGELTAIGIHVTQQVTSSSATEIYSVLKTVK
jgi:hypothetical protein